MSLIFDPPPHTHTCTNTALYIPDRKQVCRYGSWLNVYIWVYLLKLIEKDRFIVRRQ